jgi:hypothetical protein
MVEERACGGPFALCTDGKIGGPEATRLVDSRSRSWFVVLEEKGGFPGGTLVLNEWLELFSKAS